MARESSNTSNVGSRRIACHSCRVRKVKCDGAKPVCSLCTVSGFSCEYQTPAPKITLESATNSLMNKLEKLQKTVDELKQTTPTEQNGPSSMLPPQSQEDAFQMSALHMSNLVSETSKDYLTIPAQTTSADSVLLWDVFEGKYDKNLLIETMFEENKVDTVSLPKPPIEDEFEDESIFESLKDEDVPGLVTEFLQNVHTKNPVLDVESLAEYSYSFKKHNFGWDGWSCLVLIACALGCIAKPFDKALAMQPVNNYGDQLSNGEPQTSYDMFGKDIERSKLFFKLACRRIGGLGSTVVGAQCYFFAGVYLMYRMQPLASWQYFLHSSLLYDLNLKLIYGILKLERRTGQVVIRNLAEMEEKRKRLEQSMYWSCFKSECEFRVELPLPQSHVSSFHHPDLFPTPPSRSEPRETESKIDLSDRKQKPPAKRQRLQENKDVRWDLINQDESWYYYLTEIALRRIGNQIINTFFCHEPRWWLDLSPLIPIAKEFDAQLSSWSNHLPPAMRHYETTLAIRAPALQWSDHGSESFVSRELSWAIGNRVLELRSWLYQPFLFYVIHAQNPLSYPIRAQSSNSGNGSSSLSTADQAALQAMVLSGVECNLKILDVRSLRHRHHGLWFDLRSLVCASFVLLALVASGNEDFIPGGGETLWGEQPPEAPFQQVGGKIGNVLRQLAFWAHECPSLTRHHEFLHTLTRRIYYDQRRQNSH